MVTLLLLVRATYVWCCSSRTFRLWWITHLTQHHRRGCNNTSQASANYLVFLSLEQRFLNYFWCVFFSISHWCLHLSQPHNQTQKQQKTLFAIIVIFNTMLLAHPCSYSKYFMPLSLRTQGLVQKAIKQRWWNCIITALFNCITVVLCG